MITVEEQELSTSLKKYESYDYVIGIDFGSVTSGASIAHKKDPFNISTIGEWDKILEDNEEASSKLEVIPKQLPTTIFYKKHEEGEDYGISCGLRSFDEEIVKKKEGDIYIDCIKQLMLVDRDESSRLLQQYNGFTMERVFTDFIKSFHKKVIQAFENHSTFSKSPFFEKNFRTNNKLDSIRYCIASPKSLHDIIRQGFVGAGIVNENQKENRISFVAESVATAYCCIAQDREKTDIAREREYLVCDFGYSSFGVSKIITHNTETESKVELISEDQEIGSKMFVAKLKEYFMEKNQRISDSSLKPYSNGEKYFGFENDDSFLEFDNQEIEITKKDLYEQVLEPTIKEVEKAISEAEAEKKTMIMKIFLSGKYACETDFRNQLKSNKQFGMAIDVDSDFQSVDSVSIGAVSFELRNQQPSQIPFLKAEEKEVIEKKVIDEKVVTDEKGVTDEKREYKFVVGIDFGTTFSGCSYARYKSYETAEEWSEFDEEIEITTIQQWDGDNSTIGKTPTCLLYKKLTPNTLQTVTEKKVEYWGRRAKIEADIQEKAINNVKNRQILMEDFKLFLSQKLSKEVYQYDKMAFERKASDYCYKNPDMPNDEKQYLIDAIDVISDYLRKFNCEVLVKLNKLDRKGEKITSEDIKYVLTVPAFWGRDAKDILVEAARRAEMIEEKNINDLLVITEPEAAALYCETAENLESFFVGEKRFILCDGGGGTVDLVTFKYSASDEDKPSTIKQEGKPDGAMCGSTYLDANFASYINKCFEDINYPRDEGYPSIHLAMNEFKALKNGFNDDNPNKTIRFTLPKIKNKYKDCSSGKDERRHKIEKGNILVITHEKLNEHIFKPVFDQVVDAIMRKKKEVTNGENIDGIIMVGGFFQSQYLRSYITKSFETATTEVHDLNDDLGIQAISRGAVSYGLYPRLICEEFMDRSFAIEVLKSLENKSGPKRCLEYFIQENTKVDSSIKGSISKTVYVEQDKSAIIAIHTRDSKDIDDTDGTKSNYEPLTDDHKKAIEMRIDSSSFQGRVQEYGLVPITVTLDYNRNSYIITVKCNSSTVGISEKAGEELFRAVHKSSDITRNIRRFIKESSLLSTFRQEIKALSFIRWTNKKKGQ